MLNLKSPRLLLALLPLLAFTLLLAPGCKYFTKTDDPQLKEANKLEGEADALAAKVEEVYKEAAQKEEEINAAKKERARAKKLGDEQAALYDEAAKNARDAADKYEQAAKLKVDAKYQEYLNVRAQYMRKHGAHIAALKDLIAAQTEATAKPNKATRDKQTEVKSRSERLRKEVDELKAQAEKLQKENGDKFKAAKS